MTLRRIVSDHDFYLRSLVIMKPLLRFFWRLFFIHSARLIWQYPKPFLLLFVLFAGQYSYEVFLARPALLYQGEPRSQTLSQPYSWYRTLRNHGFLVGYSDLRGNPLWVEYALYTPETPTPNLPRPSHFKTDWRSLNRVSHASYTNSGYDRGHLAPNHAISQLYGKQGQLDSFLMTNISPQKATLNQQVWRHLEVLERDVFTQKLAKVWVITGPIFADSSSRLRTDWTVQIPAAFYKIYIADTPSDATPISLSFIIPQSVTGHESLQGFVSTIDEIEQQTGLDFFAELADDLEIPLEKNHEIASLCQFKHTVK